MYTGKEAFGAGFKIIATAPGSKDKDSGALDIHVNRTVDFKGESWAYRTIPLAPPYSLHTAIGKSDDKGIIRYDSYLDWHDMKTNPGTARSLVFIATDPDVSLEEKLERMERLSQSIQVYNTLMVNYDPRFSKKDLENLLSSRKLPKLQTVQLVWGDSDGGLGLNFVAKRLGLKVVGYEFHISWDRLLELSQSGELVETWKKMTSTDLGRKIMFAKPKEDPDRPETFYKDDLCLAVTGFTQSELFAMIDGDFIIPTDTNLQFGFGRDVPRDKSDKLVDRFELFMNTRIMIPLRQIPVSKLYEMAERFRRYEQYVHPQENSGNQREYYDPSYEKIKKAYREGDEVGIKVAILDLIDKILHD